MSSPALFSPSPSPQAAWHALVEAARAPYKGSGRFAWYWARGKLGHDPVFRGMLERGDLPARARVVDIGCGQGLVASLLHACEQAQLAGVWPAAWAGAPSARSYTGIELTQREVARGEPALRALPFAPHLVCADMRDAALPACDLVVILDVLHYVSIVEQDAVLLRLRDALRAGAADSQTRQAPRLLLRVGDAANRRAFAISQWVDRAVTTVRGYGAAPTWGRTLGDWMTQLQSLGFEVHSVPMSQGTPFANVLLVADLK
jgi:SAM-dependent methyltransferase